MPMCPQKSGSVFIVSLSLLKLWEKKKNRFNFPKTIDSFTVSASSKSGVTKIVETDSF